MIKEFKILVLVIILAVLIAGGIGILTKNQKEIEDKSDLTAQTNWSWLQNQKKLHEIEEKEINSVLKELHHRFPHKEDRLKALSLLRLETPYRLGCLGEEKGRDKDPLFRLDVTDCTAFVLTNVALLHAKNLDQAKDLMVDLNYRSSKEITFKNRLHFTTDRNRVSSFFSDITQKTGGV